MAALMQVQHRQLKEAVEASQSSLGVIESMAELLVTCLGNGGKVLSAGNGGSACDATHLAEELVGFYKAGNRPAFPAISLVSDATVVTCIANDVGYDRIFVRQIEALGRPGDLLIVFSTSGNSANLVTALEAARARQMKTIALLGKSGGKMRGMADLEWIVPSDQTARVQELHTWALHCLLEAVEHSFVEPRA